MVKYFRSSRKIRQAKSIDALLLQEGEVDGIAA